jgi:peroxiredoxin (alkyl hydroperoxide reductase subunit C)
MLTVGKPFPAFNLKGVVSTKIENAFVDINQEQHQDKWRIFFFWPKDFTFVCPTEIAEFGKLYQDFIDRDTHVFGISTDSEFVHLAWKQQKDELHHLPFPMLSDIKRELSHALGILDENEGIAQRATFIIDPQNIIRFVMVTDLNVGRNTKEVLRVLDALQTDELCPCNWQKGEKTIAVV